MVDVHIIDNDKYFLDNYMKNEYINDLIYKKGDNYYLKKFKNSSYGAKLTDEEILEEISILKAFFYLDENNKIPFKEKPNIRIDGEVKESRSSVYIRLGVSCECSVIVEDTLEITPKSRFKAKNLDNRNIRYILILFSEINEINLLVGLRKIHDFLKKTYGKKYYESIEISGKKMKIIEKTMNKSRTRSSAHFTTEKEYEKIKSLLSDEEVLYYFRKIIRYYVLEDRGFSEIEFLD